MNDSRQDDNLEFELSEYLDGQLSTRRARQLRRRLDREPALREELRRYASLEEHLSAMGEQALGGADYSGQRAAVIERLERKALLDARRRRPVVLRPVFWGPVAAAAAVVLAAATWLTLYTGNGAGAPSQVDVVVLAAPQSGPSEAVMVLRRIDPEELVLAGPVRWPDGSAVPAGTVLVSTGPEQTDQLAGMALPFPIEIN
ncbi:MAG TPA: hypothetical protein VM098_08935 [Phycisphaerae bacterium]|nr:hypothetical protein [Phycisphaerae bacterium]